MLHLNPWNTAIILWQAICVLWIITAAIEHSIRSLPTNAATIAVTSTQSP